MTERSSDDFDLDNTDELPVLVEPVEDVAEPLAVARHDDTAEHTELFASPMRDAEAAEALLAELTQRAEQIPALEAQIRVLTDSVRDLEQRLAEKDERLEQLRTAMAAAALPAGASTANEGHLTAELAHRDAQIAELSIAVEHLENAASARVAELERVREAAETRHGEAEELRRALAARPDTPPPGEDLREAYSTLQSYVAGRRAWWDEMQETNARLTTRATELEQELAASAKRVAEAEAFAAKESGRAVGLRAELVGYARRVDALGRELKKLRAPGDLEVTAIVDDGDLPPPTEAAYAQPSAPSESTDRDAALAPDTPPLLTDAVDAVQPAVEAIAQLEAEVEYKRQQVAAQLVELRDREQQLQAATSEVGALRSELDDNRSTVARLERTVVDKDRALEARDARIAALQEELKHRGGGTEKRGAGNFSLPTIDSRGRPTSYDGAAESTSVPALICLTGDAPKRFALTKKTITVGRGPHCDLQIITHFVSREHARLTVSGDATLIEDLGSRNGVFVNSVRVDRRHLQQGDLVTIGETQFRFVESMAH